ncbi:TPA: hypothetical protein RQO21_004535 [Klebsiella michiganensis]|nr:hypothetical protein [Klebsiella michiganensis]
MSDDELQIWCKKCVFGTAPFNRSVADQNKALEAAINDSVEYVQGMINGQPFRGWVGVTRLQAGDDVDMIVEWQHDHYEVYAIALPEERIVSVCPKCDMGHIAHMLWRIKNMFILVSIIMLMSMFMLLLREFFGGDYFNYWKSYHGPIFVVLAISLAASGFIVFFCL